MRRSSAPSQRRSSPIQNSPKLDNLIKNKNVRDSNSVLNALNSFVESIDDVSFSSETRKRPLHDDQTDISSQKIRQIDMESANFVKHNDGQLPSLNTETVRFNAVWAKVSGRKHKIWEGDCTVITDGKMTTVKDLDGKTIGVTNSAFKNTSLDEVDCGYRFLVGGKEIEIAKKISDEENVKTTSPINPPFQKGFKSVKNSQSMTKNLTPKRVVEGDSFVLPRPSSQHILKHNIEDSVIVDVIVDRRLAQNLRPHQKEGVIFLYQCVVGLNDFNGFGAILADEMGLGKTLQCISCLWTLLKQGPFGGRPIIRRCLIVVPSSLVNNWLSEFKKWLGFERLKVMIAQKSSDVKNFTDSPLCPVLIISYDLAIRCQNEMEQISFDLLICDEGHRLRNANIKANSVLASLSIKRRILLSGTPLQNDLNELFTLVDFVNPGVLGSRNEFRRNFEDHIVRSQQTDANDVEKKIGLSKSKDLKSITEQFLLRRTSELNSEYLPSKIEYVLFCKPSPLQLKLYEKLIDSRIIKSNLSQNSNSFPEHLMCIDALRKLCNHPALLYNSQENNKTDSFDASNEILNEFPADFQSNIASVSESGKLHVLFDLLAGIRQNNHKEKVVIVSNFTFTLDLLASLCKDMNYKFLRLDGSTINSARLKLVNQFNSSDDETFVFLLSSKAGGVGLNLIGANRIVLYDIDWNPANDLQAMARIWRDGQRRTCHIYRLVTTGTIEEKMFQRQVKKQNLSGAVVDLKDSGSTRFSAEELKDIFTLHKNTDCQTHELINCQCNGTEIEMVLQDEVDVDVRNYQVGSSSEPETKSLPGVTRLMEWEHRNGDHFLLTQLPTESCLETCSSGILSFIFYIMHGAKAVDS